jgi:hypothetical protein
MTLDARCGSFHSSGSSAIWFSSARRALDASKSKMPPQQPDRPLDILDDAFSFSAHFGLGSGTERPTKSFEAGM